jgi:uncharacterized protein YdcH (DUF465 family)
MSAVFGTQSEEDRVPQDEEYRKLVQEHDEYERRLLLYTEKIVLNDDEQVEETRLKKKKLQVKDRMAAILRRLRDGEGAAHP